MNKAIENLKISVEENIRLYHSAREFLIMLKRERETAIKYGVSLGVDKEHYLDQMQKLENNVRTNGNEALAKLKRTSGFNTENMKEL